MNAQDLIKQYREEAERIEKEKQTREQESEE
jgi:hypothetical protein